MFHYIFLYIILLTNFIIALQTNITTYFDCNGGSCYAPLIKPWDPNKYFFYDEDLPNIKNGILFLSGAFSNSVEIDCFDCVLLEVENKKIIVQKTNVCPQWSNGCEENNFHIDLCVPSFDNLMYSTANICDNVDIMTKEQSSINGDWYLHYDSLIEAKQNCKLLTFKYQEGCELFCDLNLSNKFKEGDFKKIDCPLE